MALRKKIKKRFFSFKVQSKLQTIHFSFFFKKKEKDGKSEENIFIIYEKKIFLPTWQDNIFLPSLIIQLLLTSIKTDKCRKLCKASSFNGIQNKVYESYIFAILQSKTT